VIYKELKLTKQAKVFSVTNSNKDDEDFTSKQQPFLSGRSVHK
jgi:hypothetical protein